MGLANNLNKFEWENEIPFSDVQVKSTLHAMIGESMMIPGLINIDSDRLRWNLNCVNPENNDTFGSYSFGQVNSKFSVTIKKINENTVNLKITIIERQGAFITGNQAYLQSECDKFIKVLTYYLQHQDAVDNWHKALKPRYAQEAVEKPLRISKGCIIAIVIFVIISGMGLGLWLGLSDLL